MKPPDIAMATWVALRRIALASTNPDAPIDLDNSGQIALLIEVIAWNPIRVTVRVVDQTTTAVEPSSAPTRMVYPWIERALPTGKAMNARPGRADT